LGQDDLDDMGSPAKRVAEDRLVRLESILEILKDFDGFKNGKEWQKLKRIYDLFQTGDLQKEQSKVQKLIQH
jgi:hypothetical protein